VKSDQLGRAAASKVAVCCIKWGQKFGPDYVNILRRAVRDNLSLPHRFVCLTDNPDGLDDEIEASPFPDFGYPREQWKRGSWPKVALFADGVFEDDEIVLYLDIDVMIVGPLDPMIALVIEKPGFHTLREWNPALLKALPESQRPVRGSQGSVYVWRAGMQRHIFAAFRNNAAHVVANYWSDRFFLPVIAVSPHYLPQQLCKSFKRHSVYYWPLNLVLRRPRQPKNCSVIVFHGIPNPTDLIHDDPRRRWGTRRKFGYGPVPWVQAYWRRYRDEPRPAQSDAVERDRVALS
jgi:hypothetical protein